MNIVGIVLEVLLGLAFLMAGIMKIAGSKMHVDNFNHWRLPQWFRPITGLVEVVGGAAMIVGIWMQSWAAWAAILLGLTMLAAVFVHLRVKDPAGKMAAPVVLLILAVLVVLIRSAELPNFPS